MSNRSVGIGESIHSPPPHHPHGSRPECSPLFRHASAVTRSVARRCNRAFSHVFEIHLLSAASRRRQGNDTIRIHRKTICGDEICDIQPQSIWSKRPEDFFALTQHKWTLYRVLSTIDAFQEMDDEATDETVGAALGPPPLPPMPVKKKRGRKSKKELGEPLNNRPNNFCAVMRHSVQDHMRDT